MVPSRENWRSSMKSDQDLKNDVAAELRWDPVLNAANIGVAAREGIVTLSGQVDNFAQKLAAERDAKRVSGVRGIAMDLEVRIESRAKRTDTDIARAAAEALRWHSLVPDDKVKVAVDEGRVTLTGEVDWAYQRSSAEACMRPLTGVVGIANLITVRVRADASDIGTQISAAFRRHAERESRHLNVAVDGSVVTLTGQVDSMAEHDAAIGTAYAAHGVSRVVDCIEVSA
jgi:osmotically-inducible protein OsmY